MRHRIHNGESGGGTHLGVRFQPNLQVIEVVMISRVQGENIFEAVDLGALQVGMDISPPDELDH